MASLFLSPQVWKSLSPFRSSKSKRHRTIPSFAWEYMEKMYFSVSQLLCRFIFRILSLLTWLEVGDGCGIPASAAALSVIIFLIATPSAPGLGLIENTANIRNANKMITLRFVNIFFVLLMMLHLFFFFLQI